MSGSVIKSAIGKSWLNSFMPIAAADFSAAVIVSVVRHSWRVLPPII